MHFFYILAWGIFQISQHLSPSFSEMCLKVEKVSKVKIVRQQKFNSHKIALHFSLDLPVSKTIYLSGWNQLNLSFQSNNGEKKFQSTKSSKIITLPIRSKP